MAFDPKKSESNQTPPPIYQMGPQVPNTLSALLSTQFKNVKVNSDSTYIQVKISGWTAETVIELSEDNDILTFYSRPTYLSWFVLLFSSAVPWLGVLLCFWIIKRSADRPEEAIRKIRVLHYRWKHGEFV